MEPWTAGFRCVVFLDAPAALTAYNSAIGCCGNVQGRGVTIGWRSGSARNFWLPQHSWVTARAKVFPARAHAPAAAYPRPGAATGVVVELIGVESHVKQPIGQTDLSLKW
jgi:hypothetical protein